MASSRRTITTRFPGHCMHCGAAIAAGEQVYYFTSSGRVLHIACSGLGHKRGKRSRPRRRRTDAMDWRVPGGMTQ